MNNVRDESYCLFTGTLDIVSRQPNRTPYDRVRFARKAQGLLTKIAKFKKKEIMPLNRKIEAGSKTSRTQGLSTLSESAMTFELVLCQFSNRFQWEIFTGRNEVVAKVMFLQVCVCPQGGEGVCLSACWDAIPPGMENPPG